MAQSDAEVLVKLELDAKNANDALEAFRLKAGATGDRVSKALSLKGVAQDVSRSIDSMTSKFNGLLVAVGAFYAAKQAVDLFRSAIGEAAELEESILRLNQALANAGVFSKEASLELINFADQLSLVTKATDEQISASLGLALTFTKSTDQAKELVQAASELSAVYGMDLDTATRTLGMTLDGTAGRISQQIPEIQNLTAAQLKLGGAIDLVNSKYGGSAASEVNTFSGAVLVLSKRWDELLEVVGKAITQSPALRELFKQVTSIVDSITNKFSGIKGVSFIDNLIIGAVKLAGVLITYVIDPIERTIELFKTLGYGIISIFSGIVSVVAMSMSGVTDAIVSSIRGIIDFLSSVSSNLGFNSITENLAKAKESLAGFGDSLREFKDDSKLVTDAFVEQTQDSFSKAFSMETASAKLSDFVDKMTESLQVAAASGKSFENSFKNNSKEVSKSSMEMAQAINANVGKAIPALVYGAMESMGASLYSGQKAWDDFKNSALGIVGDMLIQIGKAMIGLGALIDAVSAALTNLFGAGAVVAGIALIALGGYLKAQAGASLSGAAKGAAPTSAPVSSSIVATPASGPTFYDPGASTASPQDELSSISQSDLNKNEPKPVVNINVNGNILGGSSRDLGLAIVDILNENFSTSGLVLGNA